MIVLSTLAVSLVALAFALTVVRPFVAGALPDSWIHWIEDHA